MAEPGDRREFLKKAAVGSIALASLPTLGAALSTPAAADDDDDGADKVRWDIISLGFTPLTINPGGESFAEAPTHGTPPFLRIRFTGTGTFVARSGGGFSRRAKGGGTWETFGPAASGTAGPSTGTGTYRVRGLASWQFANLQSQTPVFIDNIGDTNERANGNVVLLIKYSDGSRGILGVLCHGPGAPAGIHEGVVATKGFVTYMNSEGPPPGQVNKNRTIFHVRHVEEDDDDD